MEEVKKIHGIFTAKLHSLYNYQTEVYVKQTNSNIKPKKNERSISVRFPKQKICYRVFLRKVEYTFLKLYIQDLNKTIKIDITKFLKTKYKGQKINKKFLSVLKAKISKEIIVQYIDGAWKVIDYDNLLLK